MKLRSGHKTYSARGDSPGGDKMAETNGIAAPDNKTTEDNTIHIWKFRVNRIALVTHFNIILYATCFFIQASTLPYLTKKLDVDPVWFGYLESTYAVLQLLGGPLLGRIGDIFGGRFAMCLAFSSAAMAYGILSVAYSVPMVFLSRVPVIFMHAMQAGQMIITDIGDPKQRADALGKLGLSYGVGMVLGPVLGGSIAQYTGEQSAAFTACVISIASVIISYTLIPPSLKRAATKSSTEGKSEGSLLNLTVWWRIIKQPKVLMLLSVKVILGIPLTAFQSMFGMIAVGTFHLQADQNGLLMSYVGGVVLLVQGFGIGILVKRFNEFSLIKWANFILIWAWLLTAFVQNIWQFCLVIIPKAFGISVQSIVMTSILTKSVPESDTGAMLGLSMAVHSVVRIISPSIGGYLLQTQGFASFGYFGAAVSSMVTLYLFAKLRD